MRLNSGAIERLGCLGRLDGLRMGVVRLVSRGLTNRETAERPYLCPHTVSTRPRHAFTKLDINSRVELTRLAVEHEQIRA